MMDRIEEWVMGVGDFLLGWLMGWPSDGRLLGVALGSALILLVARAWTTDQGLLRRCRDDKVRLKQMMKVAKAGGEVAVMKRYRATLGMIAIKQMREEFLPLLVAIVPLGILATWAVHRLEFQRWSVGETVEFAAFFPRSSEGQVTYLIPRAGVKAESGWVAEISELSPKEGNRLVARWRLTGEAGVESGDLVIRHGGKSFLHPVTVGGQRGEVAMGVLGTELFLKPVQLFGMVPGVPWLHLPGWMVGYLLLIVPLTFLLKRLFRVL